jgi:transposase InsO family protein
MNQLYQAIGISKQAVYQYQKRQEEFDQKMIKLLIEVEELRAEHPGCGVEKMYRTLKPTFIGRDRFIETFMELGYRVKRKKNYRKTTIPITQKFPNLIEGLILNKENLVWQSDITYIDLKERFYYAVFIEDIYSRKIVGWEVSDNLRAEANVRALKMALKERSAPIIHHSDRGSQYINKEYLKLLWDQQTHVSMGLIAQDNAYVERLNGIIKNEYLNYWDIQTFSSLKRALKKAVNHYNNRRLHNSLPGENTPIKFEQNPDKEEYTMVIHAENRIFPAESTFSWKNEVKKNALICPILN